MERQPYGRYDALITTKMWRFILGHALYQIVVLMVFLFVQRDIWFFAEVDVGRSTSHDATGFYPWCREAGVACDDFTGPRQDTTVIFNTFVFMQVFNEFNARMLENEKNMFAGIATNAIFAAVIVITVILQVLLVEFGGPFTQTSHLSARMWLGCLVFGFVVLPYGLLLRFVPVPDQCCIKSLASQAPPPSDYDDVDEYGVELAAPTPGKLKPGSHWHKAQDVHTEISVVNAFRRSGRSKRH